LRIPLRRKPFFTESAVPAKTFTGGVAIASSAVKLTGDLNADTKPFNSHLHSSINLLWLSHLFFPHQNLISQQVGFIAF